MMSNPYVSIVIPTYHDWDRLRVCLRALEKQTYPKGSFEVIVVNNDPSDQVPVNFNLQSNFRIINERMPGSYAARNAGIAVALGEIIGFTDSDCIPDTEWIESAVRFFLKFPEYDRLGGNVELFTSGATQTLAEAYEIVYAFRQEENVERSTSVTANMFTKKKVFDEVGLFNATMISGGDFEWGLRAATSNFTIGFSPDVVVKHPARKELKQLINKIRRLASGKTVIYDSSKSGLAKLVEFLYEIRPPINELKHIYSRGNHLSFKLKILVFFLRYHIRVLRAYEEIKVHSGFQPFDDVRAKS